MAADAKVTPRRWDADVLNALRALVPVSSYGGIANVAEMMQGAHLYDFTHGNCHALLAVRPVRFAGGSRLDVVGLLSDGDRLQAAQLDGALRSIALELDTSLLVMTTQIPHVAKQCQRMGWTITGAVLTSPVQFQ